MVASTGEVLEEGVAPRKDSIEQAARLSDLANEQMQLGNVQEGMQLLQQLRLLRLSSLQPTIVDTSPSLAAPNSQAPVQCAAIAPNGSASGFASQSQQQSACNSRLEADVEEGEEEEDSWESVAVVPQFMKADLHVRRSPDVALQHVSTPTPDFFLPPSGKSATVVRPGVCGGHSLPTASKGPVIRVVAASSSSRSCSASHGGGCWNDGSLGVGHDPDDLTFQGTDHVVELHDLNSSIKTLDLEEFVEAVFAESGIVPPLVRWVDDQHALLVCPSVTAARHLLSLTKPRFSLRPFAEASEASRQHAQLKQHELLPPRPRPATSTAVAKKLLSHHLGLSGLRDKGAEANLKAQRQAAKVTKKLREEQTAAAWEDG